MPENKAVRLCAGVTSHLNTHGNSIAADWGLGVTSGECKRRRAEPDIDRSESTPAEVRCRSYRA